MLGQNFHARSIASGTVRPHRDRVVRGRVTNQQTRNTQQDQRLFVHG